MATEDDDTEFLFQTLRRVGYRHGADKESSSAHPPGAKSPPPGEHETPAQVSARLKTLSRKAISGKTDAPRHASQVAPPAESANLRRSRLIRELEAGREEVFNSPNPTQPAEKPAAAAPAKPAAKPTAETGDRLRNLAEERTPAEEYRRRRQRLAPNAQINADGLEQTFARYDRRRHAMFFAELLATRQFDTFANDRVWRASRMESRITFLKAVLATHSKVCGLTPALIDDRFRTDPTTLPNSVRNQTGITGYDRERSTILIYPPFWNNLVSFPDMIAEVIEQNTRNHIRQMWQMLNNGQLRPDDPRYVQMQIFKIQIELYDEILNRMTAAQRKEQKEPDTSIFLPPGELGFDRYTRQVGQMLREQLLDVIDASGVQSRRGDP